MRRAREPACVRQCALAVVWSKCVPPPTGSRPAAHRKCDVRGGGRSGGGGAEEQGREVQRREVQRRAGEGVRYQLLKAAEERSVRSR